MLLQIDPQLLKAVVKYMDLYKQHRYYKQLHFHDSPWPEDELQSHQVVRQEMRVARDELYTTFGRRIPRLVFQYINRLEDKYRLEERKLRRVDVLTETIRNGITHPIGVYVEGDISPRAEVGITATLNLGSGQSINLDTRAWNRSSLSTLLSAKVMEVIKTHSENEIYRFVNCNLLVTIKYVSNSGLVNSLSRRAHFNALELVELDVLKSAKFI